MEKRCALAASKPRRAAPWWQANGGVLSSRVTGEGKMLAAAEETIWRMLAGGGKEA